MARLLFCLCDYTCILLIVCIPSTCILQDEDPSSSSVEAREEESVEVSKEFPQGNLYELEGRVFTDQWSIPYKKEESLGKCLVAATRLASEGDY